MGKKTLKTCKPVDTDKSRDREVPCFRCGVCCRKYQVRVDVIEVRRIADELGLGFDEFNDRFLDNRWPGAESFLFRHNESGCVFLVHKKGTNTSDCSIHCLRPSSCRDWTPDWHRTECREGLLAFWGLTVNSEGDFRGNTKDVERFQTFLKQLKMLSQD
jgi:Fe-S-cluster containining protein